VRALGARQPGTRTLHKTTRIQTRLRFIEGDLTAAGKQEEGLWIPGHQVGCDVRAGAAG
jgi:hypothetical protein